LISAIRAVTLIGRMSAAVINIGTCCDLGNLGAIPYLWKAPSDHGLRPSRVKEGNLLAGARLAAYLDGSNLSVRESRIFRVKNGLTQEVLGRLDQLPSL
jgi:hypothetical protein